MKDILKIFFFIIIFLGGLYFYTKYTNTKEGLTSMDGKNRCPNILIQKGANFYLYNSNIAEVPGVNPIEFNNLEDYVEFLEWQRGAGIVCPVLYLQNTYDAQGNRVYKVRPSVTELQGGLPPVLPVPLPTKYEYMDKNYRYPGNLEFNQATYFTQPIYPNQNKNTSTQNPINPNTNISNTGSITATNPNMLYSDNAMDPNWGGAEYTQSLVEAGYYAGDDVSLYVA